MACQLSRTPSSDYYWDSLMETDGRFYHSYIVYSCKITPRPLHCVHLSRPLYVLYRNNFFSFSDTSTDYSLILDRELLGGGLILYTCKYCTCTCMYVYLCIQVPVYYTSQFAWCWRLHVVHLLFTFVVNPTALCLFWPIHASVMWSPHFYSSSSTGNK